MVKIRMMDVKQSRSNFVIFIWFQIQNELLLHLSCLPFQSDKPTVADCMGDPVRVLYSFLMPIHVRNLLKKMKKSWVNGN